jgi:MinD superfamily P-loop ATPase
MIVSIASGKGGTGKTAVATNLARVAASSHDTWLLDCDVEAPNAHLFLAPSMRKKEIVSLLIPVVDEAECNGCGKCDEVCEFNAIAVLGDKAVTFPELCHGCGGCARFCPRGAVREAPVEIGHVEVGKAGTVTFVKGEINVGVAVIPPVVRAVRQKAMIPGTDSLVIVDAAPGTGCPVVAAIAGSDYCVLVTEPTPFGLNDLKLAVELVKHLGLPCGVVVNRTGLGGKTSEVDDYCDSEGIPVLAHIPFDRRYATCYAHGNLWVDQFPELEAVFNGLCESICGQLSPRGDSV